MEKETGSVGLGDTDPRENVALGDTDPRENVGLGDTDPRVPQSSQIQDMSAALQSEPLVSVVMPVYNAMPYLVEAVRAIQNQTYRDFEFVIVNDGSTDESAAFLSETAASDPRIRLYGHDRTDLAAVRNELVQRAVADLLVWADADDVSERERVERQVDFMLRNPACVCLGSGALCIDRSGRPIRWLRPPLNHTEIDAQHLAGQGGGVLNPTACMRRSAVLQVGGYRDPFPPSEDYDLLLRLAEVGQLANLSEVLVRYRMHPTNATFLRNREMVQHAWQALVEACQRRGLPPVSDRPPVDSSWEMSNPDLIFARWANQHGFFSSARCFGFRAVVRQPSERQCWTALSLGLFPPHSDPSSGRVRSFLTKFGRGVGRRIVSWLGVLIADFIALVQRVKERTIGALSNLSSRKG